MFFSAVNAMLYPTIELLKSVNAPYRFMVNGFHTLEDSKLNIAKGSVVNNLLIASFEILERITRTYPKLDYGIKSCTIDNKTHTILPQSILTKSFCNLIHFKKLEKINQPKLLIIAPMSGHHSTLLRSTVQDALVYFDVYLTDWLDPRDVSLDKGEFNLDTYIDYCNEFTNFIAPNVNILAVCQAAFPALVAVALAHNDKNLEIPNSLTMMGGPIDTRQNPTEVNKFALKHSYAWFKSNLITKVPAGYVGRDRQVYPGFLQLLGFIMMNPKRHFDSHLKLFNYLATNEDNAKIMQQRNFYDEYFSVMDMSAEFYLQTVKEVFQEHSLALGTFKSKDRLVDLSLVDKCSLFCIEGEKDDITGIGQTKAALTLCKNLPQNMQKYHLQKNSGHYGLFGGRRYREEILPLIKDFVYQNNKINNSKL
jgi:poly(3-hydroxybutyrate) depolymerase